MWEKMKKIKETGHWNDMSINMEVKEKIIIGYEKCMGL
jgi:hypothetical protein